MHAASRERPARSRLSRGALRHQQRQGERPERERLLHPSRPLPRLGAEFAPPPLPGVEPRWTKKKAAARAGAWRDGRPGATPSSSWRADDGARRRGVPAADPAARRPARLRCSVRAPTRVPHRERAPTAGLASEAAPAARDRAPPDDGSSGARAQKPRTNPTTLPTIRTSFSPSRTTIGAMVGCSGFRTTACGFAGEPLDGRLPVHQRHDDVPRLRVVLAPDEHEVALDDVRVDHALAADPQAEDVIAPPADPRRIERQRALAVLLGEERRAGRDTAEDGHLVPRRRPHRQGQRPRGPARRGAPLEIALPLERPR